MATMTMGNETRTSTTNTKAYWITALIVILVIMAIAFAVKYNRVNRTANVVVPPAPAYYNATAPSDNAVAPSTDSTSPSNDTSTDTINPPPVNGVPANRSTSP